MNPNIRDAILQFTQADDFSEKEVIQTLWSGYGEILRLSCLNVGLPSAEVIAKYVVLPDETAHPRGWNTSNSHQRKINSYKVESHWYRDVAQHCNDGCRVPSCLGAYEAEQECVIVLEDLDAAGFQDRVTSATQLDIALCIRWLANFHARFLNEHHPGLWPVGTYWHLDTRPDEYNALPQGELKQYAAAIDARLNKAHFTTLVHGDAKLANFCFAPNRERVAAVDFQYVGGGCGMKDLAYFISSCLHEDECEALESELLSLYFGELKQALAKLGKSVAFDALEAEWRELYIFAWADFYRFLRGWSPGHWKLHSYSERVMKDCISILKG